MEIESGRQQEEEKNFHVLAVDDSFLDRKVLEKRLLEVSSCQVTCVESGDKALEFLGLSAIDDKYQVVDEFSQHKGVKVHLIMTDYSMPGMSGYDLLKRVKGSSWKDVPVVVMSSENVPSRVSMCLEEGAEEFLLKPVQLSEVKKLQPYMKKKSASLVVEESDHETDKHCQCLCSNHHLLPDNNIDEESNIITTVQNINGNSDSDGKNNCSVSKRKAVTPDPPEKRLRNDATDFALVV